MFDKSKMAMSKIKNYEGFLNAVDDICLYCEIYGVNSTLEEVSKRESMCERCPVRAMADVAFVALKKNNKNNKIANKLKGE